MTGQRPSAPFVRQPENAPWLLTPQTPTPQRSVLVPDGSFAQPQRSNIPLVHAMSSMTQQQQPLAPHVITIAPAHNVVSFTPSHCQPQVYTTISLGGPSNVPPGFPHHTVIGQQQGPPNIARPVGGIGMQQPVYPPSQQTAPFLVASRGGPPVFIHRLPARDGAVVNNTTSLPGYVDFGHGEGDQVQFNTGFTSDPEIVGQPIEMVGQPIETVIHDRQPASRTADGRGSVNFSSSRSRGRFPAARSVVYV